jgi:plasmid stabilization system protein ParE
MRVRYSETALVEIDQIFAYFFERDRSAAAAVVERVDLLLGRSPPSFGKNCFGPSPYIIIVDSNRFGGTLLASRTE